MSGYSLRLVLELRRREEAAALADWAQASRARAEAEAEETRRIAGVSAARQQYEAARTSDVGAPGRSTTGVEGRPALASGAAAVAHARFVARRRDEVATSEARLGAFRSGPLTHARSAEEAARERHRSARQAREAFEKHEAKFQEARRRATERREEDASDDIARAGVHPGNGQRQP